ncbi:toll/interleukin-1 receptor domain-containing protein [uncultured Microbacterium sp.]|uniref:toll/interleukin-1 receptor domain-containing protein n=1 Tax=uncultured Microbacterium sp. TaxID=191216 RepID=UPI00263A074C|nr:toll/interleukin-1 receptor domain-containing protein [uncultured Microbacterium sp.]
MTTPTQDAFWSYAHEDNERSYGRVMELATAIANEYSLLSGEELELFVDRNDIRWGEAWRERIETALSDAPLFLAVVTPKYLRSIECRRELIAFSGLVKSRGLDRLLLPILYIDVPQLAEDSDDEVLALIARTQFFDWRPLRNKKPGSEEYSTAVEGIARDLMARRAEMLEVSLTRESRTDAQTVDELTATVDDINSRLDGWMESVDFDKVARVHWATIRQARLDRVDRLVQGGQPQSAIYSTFLKLGQELIPIAEDRLIKAQNYARTTIELDPLVTKAIDLVTLHPSESHLLNQLRDGVNEAIMNMDPAGWEHGYGLPSNIVGLNKAITAANDALVQSYTHVKEGNELVEAWRDRLKELDGPAVLRVI